MTWPDLKNTWPEPDFFYPKQKRIDSWPKKVWLPGIHHLFVVMSPCPQPINPLALLTTWPSSGSLASSGMAHSPILLLSSFIPTTLYIILLLENKLIRTFSLATLPFLDSMVDLIYHLLANKQGPNEEVKQIWLEEVSVSYCISKS